MDISKTKQEKTWSGKFGQDYTDRNTFTLDEMEDFYQKTWGLTRTEMNSRFLNDLKIDNILEVGSNTGNQLLVLQNSGFKNLYGIELMPYAVEASKNRTEGINLIQGSAFDVPFKDNYFDLIFTSGVLIHISPQDVEKAITEIYRCSKRYIWGFEYFSEEYTTVNYRGNEDLLWKTNFAALYLKSFPGLKLIKEERFKYFADDNIDTMFLLEKQWY
jgi:pseudaminic acid biosynthesis-associated methylase